ncbi:MAG: Panacea domain-containing protein [Halocynthiibacter sp.]
MADARIVSNFLVELAHENDETLSPMQVLKLVYIAHGYSLGYNRASLIPNRIEAWKFGPVIPDLYHATKGRGRVVKAIDVSDREDMTDGEKEFVRIVYSAYRNLDGLELSNLTHQRGTPWYEVYDAGTSNISIPDDLIENHYKGLISS